MDLLTENGKSYRLIFKWIFRTSQYAIIGYALVERFGTVNGVAIWSAFYILIRILKKKTKCTNQK